MPDMNMITLFSGQPDLAGAAFPLYRQENQVFSKWQNSHHDSVVNLRFKFKSVDLLYSLL